MTLSEVTSPKDLAPSADVPLVVEIDGALLNIDSRQETLFGMLRRLLRDLWGDPGMLLAGPDAIRKRLLEATASEVTTWPARTEIVADCERQAMRGRRVIALMDAERPVTEAVASRFEFIDEVVRVKGLSGMTGHEKARMLAERYPAGFDCSGDNASPNLAGGPLLPSLPALRTALAPLIACMRLHQWAKNALIFLPLLLDGKAGDLLAWISAAAGFVALGLVASATYIVNDVWDLVDDRRHWSKCRRPIASGEVPIAHAMLWAAALAMIGFAVSIAVNIQSMLLLGLYAVVTLSYTFGVKRVPILDIVVLAGLFTLRLALGMALTDAKVSYWLLVFSMFVFTSLSAAKRHTELRRQIEKGSVNHGRGYVLADLPLLLSFGLASMFAALLISVLYLIEDAFPSGFYSDPMYLWSIPVLLSLFLGRIWLLSQRGELNDDPVEFAVLDKASLALGMVMTVSLIAALLG